MNVLVTGGSGRIGGYVLREMLGAGHLVSSFSRSAPLISGAGFIQGDIMDIDRLKEACRGHDAIIHLAATAAPARVNPERLLDVNIMGTVNVLEAAVQAGAGKVVFASSGAATGFSFQKREIVPRYLPFDEEHPSEPQDEYGLSKLLAELACKRYSAAYGIQTICLRINNNWSLDRASAEVVIRSGWTRYNAVEELWQGRYIKAVSDSDDWPMPGPPSPKNLLWAYTDARDAAQAFRLAIENDKIVHQTFQINASDTSSIVETRELIARHYPNVPLKMSLDGYVTLISHTKATNMLGYRPQYSWRNSDFKTWMDSRR